MQANGVSTAQYDYISRLSPTTSQTLIHPPFVHRADVQHFYPSKRTPVSTSNTPLSPATLASSTTTVFSMLEDFDTQPPFTVQRLCELVLHPTRHYTTASKWINALRRCLSVTATRDAFPISPVQAPVGVVGVNGSHAVSEVDMDRMDGLPPNSAEPLFSPIPFIARNDGNDQDAVPDLELSGADRTQTDEPPREIVDAPPAVTTAREAEMQEDAPTASTDEGGSVAAQVEQVVERGEVLGVPDGQVDELDNPNQRMEAITSTTEVVAAPTEGQSEMRVEQEVKPVNEKEAVEAVKDEEDEEEEEDREEQDGRSTKRRKSIASIHDE